MSTFKQANNTSSNLIEMPSKEISFNNLNNNENIYNNDQTIRMYDKKLIKEPSIKEDETNFQLNSSRKNSLNSISTNSNLSFKLNRQNAIDEADTKTYEYVMHTPQISFSKNELNKQIDDDNEKKSLDFKNFDIIDNQSNSIKYFK